MSLCENSIPRPLSAKFREDFAYPTVKDRIPVILTKIVDQVYRLKKDALDQEHNSAVAVEDLKQICGALSKLKNEIQTDKPLLPLTDGCSDAEEWNQYLDQVTASQDGVSASWFKSAWLYTECYFYRRVMNDIHLSSKMKNFDPFGTQKRSTFSTSMSAISKLGDHMMHITTSPDMKDLDTLRDNFIQLIQVCLWGNKCDLSISAGADVSQSHNLLAQLSDLTAFIISDHSALVWQKLTSIKSNSQKPRIDIILDNAGFELFTDLCFAEFLITMGYADSVHFHGKKIPWFVSDVTHYDFDWLLTQLEQSDVSSLHALGKKWKGHIKNGTWKYVDHDFWTMPYDFSRMHERSPDLYRELSRADLLFFKGDLNYRKLTGDLKWDHTVDFGLTLRGFGPAPICAIRTLKCDLAVGLRENVAEATANKDAQWLIGGNWAVIQMFDTLSGNN